MIRYLEISHVDCNVMNGNDFHSHHNKISVDIRHSTAEYGKSKYYADRVHCVWLILKNINILLVKKIFILDFKTFKIWKIKVIINTWVFDYFLELKKFK